MVSAINYEPSADDVFVVTYPKCGTTWMIEMVMLILRKGKVPLESHDYFNASPFLELVGSEAIKTMSRPGCLKTHLPFDLIPFSPQAKYIYVARHPKDCAVSFYHHSKFFPSYHFTNGTFEEFFEHFINGDVYFSDYFDHLLSWYDQRHCPNVFFTTFEDMKRDSRGTILKVAKFLGEEYSNLLEEDEKLLEEIARKSSFQYMQNNVNGMMNDMMAHPWDIVHDPSIPEGVRFWAKVTAEAQEAGERSIGQFMRAGGNSDGKIYFSAEQETRFRQRTAEKTRNSDVMDIWNKVE